MKYNTTKYKKLYIFFLNIIIQTLQHLCKANIRNDHPYLSIFHISQPFYNLIGFKINYYHQ